MGFLEINCILKTITDDTLKECHPFACGDDDMDEVFDYERDVQEAIKDTPMVRL